MSVARHLHRPAGLGALAAVACVLLVSLTTGAAVAATDPLAHERSQERYYSSYGSPDRPDPALAQERYLASYGEPQPLSPPQSQDVADTTPWLPIALSIAGVLILVTVTATQARRARSRRRAVQTTA